MILHNELNLSERDLVPDHLENSLDRPTLETTMLDESRHRGSIHPITIQKSLPSNRSRPNILRYLSSPGDTYPSIFVYGLRLEHPHGYLTVHLSPPRTAHLYATHARKHARAHTERSDERETEREDTKSAHLLRVPPP